MTPFQIQRVAALAGATGMLYFGFAIAFSLDWVRVIYPVFAVAVVVLLAYVFAVTRPEPKQPRPSTVRARMNAASRDKT